VGARVRAQGARKSVSGLTSTYSVDSIDSSKTREEGTLAKPALCLVGNYKRLRVHAAHSGTAHAEVVAGLTDI